MVLFLATEETLLYSQNRLALGPTKPLIEWVMEANHSPPLSAEVKSEQSYISTCPYPFMTLHLLYCY